MKIESTNVYCLRISLPSEVGDSMLDVNHWDIVATEIITDTNLVGWGYNSTLAIGSRALVSILRDELAPRLVGQDPYLLKKIWKEIYLDNHFTGIYGIASQGIAAIEIALWDLICKDCNKPLWKILGGFNSERIPCYSTDGGWIGFTEQQLVDNALRIQASGFFGFKMKVGKPDIQEDRSRLAAVRKAVGPGYPVMIDVNGRWDLPTAIASIATLQDFDPFWVEEPLHPFDVRSHAKLAEKIRPPILVGETIYDLRMFNDFIVRGGMNIAQPDVMRLGGISGWLEASALAKANGLPVVPAAFNLMQIDAHLMASITNGLVMEHIPWLHSVFERPLTVREGHVMVPQDAGVGTDVSSTALRELAIEM